MAEFFETLGPWTWVLAGLVLLILEIFVAVPGSLFLFSGVAALVIGASALLFDWGWQFQLIGFAALATVLVLVGRRYFARRSPEEVALGLNDRAVRLVGSVYALSEPIVDGRGRVRVGDSTWGVVGPDTPSGSRVRVIGTDGALLRVEPVEAT